MIIPEEDCMMGFLKSCDYDHKPGISKKEWSTCFPPIVRGKCACARLRSKSIISASTCIPIFFFFNVTVTRSLHTTEQLQQHFMLF